MSRNIPHGWTEYESVESTIQAPIERVRYFGLYKTQTGKIAEFICYEESKIPYKTLEVRNGTYSIEVIREQLIQMGKQFSDIVGVKSVTPKKIKPEETMPKRLTVGDVVMCADGEGVHAAVVLEMNHHEAGLVFCTSNPYWNPQSRLATKDELALLGMPIKHRTYFAPVVRPTDRLSSLHKSFPKDRIRNLVLEFDWELALEY